MATLSLDLRQRILKAYDRGDATRDQVALRFDVSLGMVKKLIQQRRHTGDIAPRHGNSGRKPVILASHRRALKAALRDRHDLTLEELRSRLGLACTIQAIHYVLVDMGLTYKKRHSTPANRTGRTSSGPAGLGGAAKAGSIRSGSCSSTSRRPRRT